MAVRQNASKIEAKLDAMNAEYVEKSDDNNGLRQILCSEAKYLTIKWEWRK